MSDHSSWSPGSRHVTSLAAGLSRQRERPPSSRAPRLGVGPAQDAAGAAQEVEQDGLRLEQGAGGGGLAPPGLQLRAGEAGQGDLVGRRRHVSDRPRPTAAWATREQVRWRGPGGGEVGGVRTGHRAAVVPAVAALGCEFVRRNPIPSYRPTATAGGQCSD